MRASLSYALNLLCLAAALATLASRPGLAQSGMLNVRTFCTPLEIHEGQPDEKACLKQFADVVTREGRALTFNLKDGKTKVLSDAKECEDPDKEGQCYTYRLEGFLGDRYFIVSVTPYECAYALLVNRRTGQETKLGGWPKLSPSRKRFVDNASFVAGECSPDYNIGIYSLASDPPRLEWHFTADSDSDDYIGEDWDGENRVRVLANVGGKESKTDLKLTAQGWQLRLPNGQLSSGDPASARHANDPTSTPAPAAPPAH